MAHIHEKIDFCVEAFIVHENKVLLRMHDKLKFWLSIGGHIELDEDPIEAIHREVKEEVGLDIKILGEADGPQDGTKYLIPPKFLNRHHIGKEGHEHVVFVYFATSDTGNITQSLNEHERSETRWVSIEELKNMDLVPNVRFYAEEALKELSDK